MTDAQGTYTGAREGGLAGGRPRLALPRRLAVITAALAVALVVGATEAAFRLAERSRLADLRDESVDLATTLASYLTRIAPTGDPGSLRIGLTGWSRRHLTHTSAMVYVARAGDLLLTAASDSDASAPPSPLARAALARHATTAAFLHQDPWLLEIAVPLGAARAYGVLDVRVAAGRLAAWAHDERRRAYAFALAAALLVAAGVWGLTARWIGAPLASLSAAMAGAHGGSSGAPIAPLVGPPEFRDVARRYNALQAALALREQESRAQAGLLALEERARGLDRLAQAEAITGSFAHEIGTPLNTMNGHLQLLREDLRTGGDPAAAERVALLLAQLARVSRIVREALQGRSWPVPLLARTDVGEVVSRLLRFLAPALASAGIEVQTRLPATPAVARTDADLVEQILLNLLKNSLEALAAGGHVELQVSATATAIEVMVADDGPGLPEATRHQLFQPYTSSKPAGTGLGLAVSRRLARSLEGDLAVHPSERGTRWCLTLPAASPA